MAATDPEQMLVDMEYIYTTATRQLQGPILNISVTNRISNAVEKYPAHVLIFQFIITYNQNDKQQLENSLESEFKVYT
jgi:hypothetical protein